MPCSYESSLAQGSHYVLVMGPSQGSSPGVRRALRDGRGLRVQSSGENAACSFVHPMRHTLQSATDDPSHVYGATERDCATTSAFSSTTAPPSSRSPARRSSVGM